MRIFTSPHTVLCLLLVMLCCGRLTQAQSWQSAMTVGNPAAPTTAVATMQTDASGNVYILGSFTGTLTLGNTTLTSAGSKDIFVAKWNPATSSFVWAVRAGGASLETPMALAVNYPAIYLTGDYSGANATFGSNTLPNAGTTADVFVAKLTDAGSSASFTWVLTGGGTNSDTGSTLAVLGNTVYVGGVYTSATPSFGSTTLSNTGGQDIFLAKITDNGTTAGFSWVQPFRYNSANGENISALVASNSGVYLAGYYNNYSSPIGVGLVSYNTFLTKLIDNGNSASYGWQQTPPDVSALAVDGASLYVAGTFKVAALFGATTLTGPPIGPAANGACEAYVAKLVDAGATSSYAWAKQTVNVRTLSITSISSLKVKDAAVYASGYSNNSTSVLGSAVIPAGCFVTKLADAGSTVSSMWTLQTTGAYFADNALAVSSTSVYVAGTISTQVTFGNIVLSTAPTNTQEPFLATISDAVLTSRSSASLAGFNLYPNPAHATTTVRIPSGASPVVLTLLDALGRIVRIQSVATGQDYPLDLTGLAPGVYALRVQAGAALSTQKLVVD